MYTYIGSSSVDNTLMLWCGFTVYVVASHLNKSSLAMSLPELQTRRRCTAQWLTRRTTSSEKMAALSVRKTSFKTQENTSLYSLKRYNVICPYYQDNELSCMNAELGTL